MTRSTAREEGVHLIARVDEVGGADPLPSPVEAAVSQGLRRGLAIGLAPGARCADVTGLAAMKRETPRDGCRAREAWRSRSVWRRRR